MTSTNHELPSLPTAITNPTKYLNDPNYLISQKIDGRRLVAGVRDRKPFAYNRSGDSLTLPPHLDEILKRRFPGSWLFDGELIDKDYYIFDVLEFPGGKLTNNPYSERLQLIESILSEGQIPVLHYVPSHGLNKHQFYPLPKRCLLYLHIPIMRLAPMVYVDKCYAQHHQCLKKQDKTRR